MDRYDPDLDPPPDEWLALDEHERISLAERYHRRRRIRLPNLTLHAVVHVIVENQLAAGELAVVETMARLRSEGLDRHDALHAIGSVLTGQLHSILLDPLGHERPTEKYFDGLRKLSARTWSDS